VLLRKQRTLWEQSWLGGNPPSLAGANGPRCHLADLVLGVTQAQRLSAYCLVKLALAQNTCPLIWVLKGK